MKTLFFGLTLLLSLNVFAESLALEDCAKGNQDKRTIVLDKDVKGSTATLDNGVKGN